MANRGKVAPECEAPLYKQLEESFIAEIAAGRLKPGDVVPSTYTLAEQYGISRVTAVRCYEELKGRGFLVARRGGCTVVNPRLAVDSENVHLKSNESFANSRFDNLFGESLSMPPAHLLPTKAWIKAMQSIAESNAQEPAIGAPRLRGAIASFLMRMRGLSVYPRNLLLFDSKWQAIAFVAKNFLAPGDRVAVENPGDPLIFSEFSSRVAGVDLMPVDREGALVENLEWRSGLRLIAVSPCAQHPTGVIMSERRRQQLSRYAGQNEAMLLEDDGAALIRFGKQPEPALYNKFKDAIHVGSFGHYLGSLCQIAYLVVPDHLLEKLSGDIDARVFSQPTFVHSTLVKLIESGALELAIFKQRAVLHKHRQQILSLLLAEFKDILTVNAGATGFDLLLRFNPRFHKNEILQALQISGIDTGRLDGCYQDKGARERAEVLLPLLPAQEFLSNSIEKLLNAKLHLLAPGVVVSPIASAASDEAKDFALSQNVQNPRLMYFGQ